MVALRNAPRLCCMALLAGGALALEQNPPPSWGETTYIFGPEDNPGYIQSKVNAAWERNGGHTTGNSPPGEFSNERYAFLFKPGTYSTEVPVGYYTTVAGLGRSPDDVVFGAGGGKGVYAEEGSWLYSVGSLDTFWRSIENFRSEADHAWFGNARGTIWAVSQAAPMRRVHVTKDLYLFQYKQGDCGGVPCQGPYWAAGYASGGFAANLRVDGSIMAGGQQQWFSRNVDMRSWHNGAWNIVTVGCNGNSPSSCDHSGDGPQHVNVERAPAIAEKPYITVSPADSSKFQLVLPGFKCNSKGSSWGDLEGAAGRGDIESSFIQVPRRNSSTSSPLSSPSALPSHPSECTESQDRAIDFEHVFVAVAGRDTAAAINAKLSSSEVDAVVFSAGIYHLEETLVISQSSFVVLGLGLATLIPTTGRPAIKVLPGLSNVRLASVLLQASSVRSPSLLDWGVIGDTCSQCVISDLFTRVGGPDGSLQKPSAVDVFVHLRSGGIVGDNFWLWRADHTHHGVGTHPATNPCKTGLIVDGDDVTMYGLAVEHTLEDMTVWNGERGRTYFYQAEFPYGVEESWGAGNFAGYRVADHVQIHNSYGMGVYHFFRDHSPRAYTGIRVPPHLVKSMIQPIGVYLSGRGSMVHVINDFGATTAGNSQGAAVAFTCIGLGQHNDHLPPKDYMAMATHSRDYSPPGVRPGQEGEDVSYLQDAKRRSVHEL